MGEKFRRRLWWRSPASRIVLVFVVVLVSLSGAPPLAQAAFTRPFDRAIVGTPTGTGNGVLPFSELGGAATDFAGNFWIADKGTEQLDGFTSAVGGNSFVEAVELMGSSRTPQGSTLPDSLAIDFSTKNFYITGKGTRNAYDPFVEVFDGTGKLMQFKEWEDLEFAIGTGGSAYVTVDNASDPFDMSAGSIYVSHGGRDSAPPFGDGLPQGVEKFDVAGGPVAFDAAKECEEEHCGYITDNEITGVPGEGFGSADLRGAPGSLVVDGEGNIFVVDSNYNAKSKQPSLTGGVVEYTPNGRFVRAFVGGGTPGVGEDREGFGGNLAGVAVDPSNGDVLVAVVNSGEKLGVIDEFDGSGRFLNQVSAVGSGSLSAGLGELAVDSSGDLYVVDHGAGVVDVLGPGVALPSVSLSEVSTREQSNVALNGSVVPGGLGLNECFFEFVSETEYNPDATDPFAAGAHASCEPAAGSIPADSISHAVMARVSGLSPGVPYRYRLVARTEGTHGGVGFSETLTFTDPGAPRVVSSSASGLSSSFADLRAVIDPSGADTSYHFEFVSDAGYEPAEADPYARGSTAPAMVAGASGPSEVDIGSGGLSGSTNASVMQRVGGLFPGMTYHFRVIASNSAGMVFGPDDTFTMLPVSVLGLSDGREYEMLTPPNKGSSEDMFSAQEAEFHEFANSDVGYPSGSGDEFLLETKAAFGPFAAAGQNAYVFKRDETAGDWRSVPVASPSLGVQSVSPSVFDPNNFSTLGVSDIVGAEASVDGARDVSMLGPVGGAYTEIHSEPVVEQSEAGTRIVGSSRDLSRIVLESSDHGVVGGIEKEVSASHALYEWFDGEYKLLSVKPDGSPFLCGAFLGNSFYGGARHNAVSADGFRMFFDAPDPYAKNDGPECWDGGMANAPQLYMRFGGETVRVSAPQEGVSDPTGQHSALFVGASEDGSKVFFLSETELTGDDTWHSPELYEYDTQAPEGERLVRISRGDLDSGPAEGNVFTVPAISADGGVVYFMAFGQLTSEAPAVKGGEVNLYRYNTMSRSIIYVATVDVHDYASTDYANWWAGRYPHEVALDTNANWYATPDGRYLLFTSTNELTKYSTAEAGPEDNCDFLDSGSGGGNGHCAEVYRYDSDLPLSRGKSAVPDNPVCVSCDPNGESPESNAFFAHSANPNAPAGGSVRAMSDDGSYAFFDTADPLVPWDGNGTLDVYEWEAQGKNGCQLERGCVYLISSGQDRSASFFLGASVDGSNAFFGTHARLVPRDTDAAGDLYDARIGGGFPVHGGVGPCEGDACQNPPPAPLDQTPSSVTFSGPEEVQSKATLKEAVPTNKQKLKKALKACAKKPRGRRARCVARARIRYARKAARRSVGAPHSTKSGRRKR